MRLTEVRRPVCDAVVGLVMAAVLGCAVGTLPLHAQGDRGGATQRNNVGVAYMNEQSPEKAMAEFRAASQLDPHLAIPVANEGEALLAMGKPDAAEQRFEAALVLDGNDLNAWYSLGLARHATGRGTALDAFRRAEALAPHDADVHYQIGTLLAGQDQFEAAAVEFKQALRDNPLHASAEFGLAHADQRLKQPDQAREHFARFSAMSKAKTGVLISASYGEQGRLAQARDLRTDGGDPAGSMVPVRFEAVAGASNRANGPHLDGAVCQLSSRQSTLFLLPGDTGLAVYRLESSGALLPVDAAGLGLSLPGKGRACAVGDYDNDGLPDLAVATADRVVLFHNAGNGRFEDRTLAAGLPATGSAAGVSFVDYDHDGDLDLLLTGTGGQALWRNNGNGTFTGWTNEAGLEPLRAAHALLPSDVNNDRAVDLVVAADEGAPALLLNHRDGPFTRQALWKTDAPISPARGVATFDFDRDGWMDVLATHAGAPGVSLWRNVQGSFSRVPLPLTGIAGAWAAVPLDFDNDGLIDIAVLAEGAGGASLRMLRNLGDGKFADVSAALGLDRLDVRGARGLRTGDFTGHAAADLLVTFQDRAPLVLRNIGGDRHRSMRVRLTGLADNKSAIGTKVEVFSGGNWQKFEINTSNGSTELLAGLGDAEQVDVLRMLWPTGVLQDEVHLRADKLAEITELDRRGSSCPVLFAWNGAKYTFVTDVIGAGVVGHWVAPNARNRPNPGEWIKIDGDALKPVAGRLSVRFGEPMEEVNYIDQLRLVAMDHPADTAVYPDERFLDAPPFASGKPVLVSSRAHPPVAATDDHGHDALPVLRAQDGMYLNDFTNLQYAGFANDHALLLDLGPTTPAAPLRLVLRGYVEYFSASSMYAAWQAGIAPHAPSLDVQLPDGSWKEAVHEMGFPAGLPRTIVVDLSGKLPAGARRVRIRTNLQIYWDQVLVDQAPAASPAALHATALPLREATLAFRGYPQQNDGKSPGELTYDYEHISPTGPFAWQRGAYTKYGEVTPLLQNKDNRMVIFGSGEDVDGEFDATALPPLPTGWKRDYFFFADGYVKDMDFYDAAPFTVNDLPFHGMSGYPYRSSEHFPDDPAAVAYNLEWNTRMETGNRPQRFAFDYRAVHLTPIQTAADQAAASGGTR